MGATEGVGTGLGIIAATLERTSPEAAVGLNLKARPTEEAVKGELRGQGSPAGGPRRKELHVKRKRGREH